MCHVLIIEDEPLIAFGLRDFLEEEGATSFAFADTQASAIESALARIPAFITSDVRLTQGTGPLAVASIQEQLGPIPVVFITGTPGACHPHSPLDRIFGKPFNHADLSRAFHEMRSR